MRSYGWALILYDWCAYKNRSVLRQYTERQLCEPTVRKQLPTSQGEKSQEQTAETLILDFPPLELWENKHLPFKAPCLGLFAIDQSILHSISSRQIVAAYLYLVSRLPQPGHSCRGSGFSSRRRTLSSGYPSLPGGHGPACSPCCLRKMSAFSVSRTPLALKADTVSDFRSYWLSKWSWESPRTKVGCFDLQDMPITGDPGWSPAGSRKELFHFYWDLYANGEDQLEPQFWFAISNSRGGPSTGSSLIRAWNQHSLGWGCPGLCNHLSKDPHFHCLSLAVSLGLTA